MQLRCALANKGMDGKEGQGTRRPRPQAAQIFGGLDVSTDGVLNRSEFSKSLGIMGTSNSVLSNFIFDVRGHSKLPAADKRAWTTA